MLAQSNAPTAFLSSGSLFLLFPFTLASSTHWMAASIFLNRTSV